MKIKEIYPSSIVERKQPKNIVAGDEILFKHEFKKSIPSSYLNEYRNVLISFDGFFFKSNYIPIKDAPIIVKRDFDQYKYRYILSLLLKKKKKTLPKGKTYITAFDRYSIGYFHYMTDFLTRLVEIQDYLSYCTLILPEYFNQGFRKKLLESFKINDIIFIKKNEYLKVPHLLVPDYIAPTGNYNIKNIRKLQQHLLKYYNPYKSEGKNHKYYVSREKAAWRYLINEREVRKIMSDFDIHTIFFEDYSIEEQIKICYNSSLIISSHGANLTNCMFMKPGTSVMELRKKDDYINHCYYSLASAFDINYFYQQCDYIDRKKGNYFDLNVDLDLLQKNLKLIHK